LTWLAGRHQMYRASTTAPEFFGGFSRRPSKSYGLARSLSLPAAEPGK